MNRSAQSDSIETHQLSNAILDNMVTATLMLDEQLYVRYANPAAEQLFSQSAKRIVDHPLSQLIQHASLDLALLTQPLQSGQSITDSDVTFVVDNPPIDVRGDGEPDDMAARNSAAG